MLRRHFAYDLSVMIGHVVVLVLVDVVVVVLTFTSSHAFSYRIDEGISFVVVVIITFLLI